MLRMLTADHEGDEGDDGGRWTGHYLPHTLTLL